MNEPKEPDRPDEGAPGEEPESRNPRTLLGAYPVQSREIVPPADMAGEIWGTDIDSYPLRAREADPHWAVRTVWIWVFFDLVCIGLIGALLIFWAVAD